MERARRAIASGILAWAAVLLGTSIVPRAACADTLAERTAAARAAGDDLVSADAAVRATAATRLAELGRLGAVEAARRGVELDDRAWKACADAFVKAKCRGCAFTFVTAARTAPPTHASRLVALAHDLDPLAGVQRTPAETAAEVRRLLDIADRARCSYGCEEQIALLGHDALEPLLATMRDGDPSHPGGWVACSAVALLAEKEDLAAIRELLLAGKVNLVRVVERMQRDGVPGTTDALLDAARAGRLGSDVTRALAAAPDKARVLEALDELASHPAADRHRASLAVLFVRLDAKTTGPRLESWLATTSDPDDFVAIGEALVHFGNAKGVGVLVKVASERVTSFPCRPSTPEELAAASAPGRLCAKGFSQSERSRAAQRLSEIAGKDVFDVPEDWSDRLSKQGPGRESEDAYLDRAAAAFRRWWDRSKDRLRYDASTGRWTTGT